MNTAQQIKIVDHLLNPTLSVLIHLSRVTQLPVTEIAEFLNSLSVEPSETKNNGIAISVWLNRVHNELLSALDECQ